MYQPEDYLSIMQTTPLRQEYSENDSLIKIFKDEARHLFEEAEIIVNRAEEPLNVVVLGEVKAGKSSLINAIVKDNVAPVGVTETTSCIMDIVFCEQPSASLLIDGKVEKTGSREEIIEYYEQKGEEIRKNSRNIEIHLSLNSLGLKNFHLVDTPGLETINTAFEDTTVGFLSSADVIIWVFNANHVGQTDVRERLSAIAKLGKPMVAAINKIDEIGSEADSIIEYFRNNYSIYFQRIMGVSALLARNGFAQDNESLITTSGIKSLLDYLADVDNHVRQVKKESILSSMQAITIKDSALHKLAMENVTHNLDQISLFSEKCGYHKDLISKKLKHLAEDWIDHKLLADEENAIYMAIDGKHSASDINSMVQNAVSKENIDKQLKEFYLHIDQTVKDEWNKAIDEITLELQHTDIAHQDFQRKIIANVQAENVTLSDMFVDGLKKGATMGGTLGLVGGALIVGTTAVTMPALLVFVPLYAALGALTGGISNLFGLSKNKEKLKKDITNEFRRARVEFYNDFSPKFTNELERSMSSTINELRAKFAEQSGLPSEAKLLQYKNEATLTQ